MSHFNPFKLHFCNVNEPLLSSFTTQRINVDRSDQITTCNSNSPDFRTLSFPLLLDFTHTPTNNTDCLHNVYTNKLHMGLNFAPFSHLHSFDPYGLL